MRYVVFADLMRRDLEAITGAPVPVVLVSKHPQPLAIGIRERMLERYPDADEQKLGRWLRIWTSQRPYRQALTVGRARYDLDGKVVGSVTADEERDALAKIAHDMKRPLKTVGAGGRPILRLKQPVQQAAA